MAEKQSEIFVVKFGIYVVALPRRLPDRIFRPGNRLAALKEPLRIPATRLCRATMVFRGAPH
jgi:hypothetical protein